MELLSKVCFNALKNNLLYIPATGENLLFMSKTNVYCTSAVVVMAPEFEASEDRLDTVP